jgi:SAM-dependent methyltransferase
VTTDLLACPATRLPLRPESSDALVSDDGSWRYDVLEDVPNLLAPEAADGAGEGLRGDERYAEAYAEMAYYDHVASSWAAKLEAALAGNERVDPHRSSGDPVVEGARIAALARTRIDRSRFPDPPSVWLHLRHEGLALQDAYRHLAPLDGKRVLQIGGIGLDAVKFLLAGAAEVWLLSPMLGELRYARTLAEAAAVGDRLHRVRGVAEELPFRTASFDAVFAGGSIHHTVTHLSLPEAARVLRSGAVFASVEPWRGPGYGWGTRLLGKREPVHCRPLTVESVAPLFAAFSAPRVIHHGALTRYPLVALEQLGVPLPARALWLATRADDAFTSLAPRLARTGSSVSLLAVR